jgi:hypothetical protein
MFEMMWAGEAWPRDASRGADAGSEMRRTQGPQMIVEH